VNLNVKTVAREGQLVSLTRVCEHVHGVDTVAREGQLALREYVNMFMVLTQWHARGS
jgi:hypothetical protein